jgi:hypothetical protein
MKLVTVSGEIHVQDNLEPLGAISILKKKSGKAIQKQQVEPEIGMDGTYPLKETEENPGGGLNTLAIAECKIPI